MKTSRFMLLGGALLAAVTFSCNDKETEAPVEPTPVKTRTVTVSVDVADLPEETRVAFADDRTFAWEEGDQIGIYTFGTTPETIDDYYPNFVPFTLTSGAGSSRAGFSAELPEGVDYGYVAVYPYHEWSSGFNPDDNVLSYGLPDEWEDAADLGAKVRIPMAAKIDMSGATPKDKFTFYHLGGAVKVTLTDVPAEVNSLTLSAYGAGASGRLSGGFNIALDQIGSEAMVYDSGASDVKILFPDNVSAPSELVVYFPVPCGTFNLTLRVQGRNYYDFTREAWSSNTVTRGAIVQMPAFALPAPAEGWEPYVDLGLPSGTLWATRNVDADRPDQIGTEYHWGMTESTNFTVWKRYAWTASGTTDDNVTFSKYGYDGGNTVRLEQADDAAHSMLKGKWRMPTAPELEELIGQAQWQAYDFVGTMGYKVTGPSGRWIFLPAQNRPEADVWYASYWSNELDNSDERGIMALGMYFDQSGVNYTSFKKIEQVLVRPVYDPELVEELHFGREGYAGQDVNKGDVVNAGDF